MRQPLSADRQRKRKAGRRATFAVTQLLELFEAAIGADDSDSLQTCLLVVLEVKRRCELQAQKVSAKLSDKEGIGDDERKDFAARLAELRLLEYVASVLAGRIEQRLLDAGQQLVRPN